MANFEYRGRIDLDEYVRGDRVNDINHWPRIVKSREGADNFEDHRKSLAGLRPRFSDTFPKGLVDLLAEACEGVEESRKIIYGFIHDGRFDRLETRKELLAKLPNLRPLLDMYPEREECEAGFGEFRRALESTERSIELNMVGPAGLNADLNRYVSRKSTRELGTGWVPIYARITTRPVGPAPEADGIRPYEKHLHDFLTTLYGEAGVIALDRTVDKPSDVRMWVSWNWLSPPEDHPVGPENQLARFMVKQRDFKTWRMPGEPDEEFDDA